MIAATWYNTENSNARNVSAFGRMVKAWRCFNMGILSRKKICGIYKITNLINGKCYVGQSRDIKARWSQHRCGREKDHNYYLSNAISKYGIESFLFEILEECGIDSLNDLERKYILTHNTMKPNGYNLQDGGHAGKVVTLETRGKLSRATSRFFSTSLSDGLRKILLASHKKIPVSQYTKSGEYVATYKSIKEASETIGVFAQNIYGCCRNKQQSAGGYQWQYADKNIAKMNPLIREYKPTRVVSVSQFTQKGEHIKTYKSMGEAVKETGTNINSICGCCRGRIKTGGGFVWRYENEPDN